MNDRKKRLLCVILLTCAVTWIVPVAGWADGADTQGVIQAVHSFQQLAVLDPVTAGVAWMEDRAASDWQRLVESSVDDLFDASILFGHVIPFAFADDTGAHAGLYSPWVGMLLLLDYDSLASVIESFSIHPATRLPNDLDDPAAFAASAMASIDSAAAVFEAFTGGESPREELSAKDLGQRIDETAEALDALYGAVDQPTENDEALRSAVDRVFADELEGPLALLDSESRDWINFLLPLWMGKQVSSSFVVLASMASPFDWVWLEVDSMRAESPIRSVSMVRLYDRIVTQGGEGS